MESFSATRGFDTVSLHRRLNTNNHSRLLPAGDASDWRQRLARDYEQRILECRFVEEERQEVSGQALAVPTEPGAFVAWFEQLKEIGAGQRDPLFPWLATRASLQDMRWFLRQEVAGEAGFEDLVALTQVKLPDRAKLEMARNYWDEMGQGNPGGMHGPMLTRLAEALGLSRSEEPVWESLALGNLMLALAANRHYAYQSLGALGVIELTAPGRADKVNAGLKRLGIGGEIRRYFALHATLDVRHSEAWDKEILYPLVQEAPDAARFIAEGALMRLNAGARCFARYRTELGLDREQQAS